jgi:hypothetical protein
MAAVNEVSPVDPAGDRNIRVFIAINGGLLSAIAMYGVTDYFGDIRAGAFFFFGMVPVAVCSLIALAGAFDKGKRGLRGQIFLSSLCLAPSLIIAAPLEFAKIQDEMNRPFEMFRAGIENPIPESVKALQFLIGGQTNGPQPLLRFEISHIDLDRIIHNSDYILVDFNKLNHSDDHFSNPNFVRRGDHD